MQPLASLDLMKAEMDVVEKEISRLTKAPVPIVSRVIRHTIGAGGKRLRPMLTMLSAKAVGEVNRQVVTLAGLIELAHTVALIHDDVIDEAETRRGRKSANVLWGNEATILVGDYLIAQIVIVLSETEFIPFQALVASAAQRTCVGQLLEIEQRHWVEASEADYTNLIRNKTGELISTACQVGALAARGTKDQAEALGEYGMNLGLAFQIADDLLDIVSNGKHLGKPVGNDLREGKVTLPYIRTLSVAEPADRRHLEELLSERHPSEQIVKQAISIVHRYDGITYSNAVARQYIQTAKAALDIIPDSQYKTILKTMADFAVMRDK